MTPSEADSRLSAAERGARSYGDATYTSAVALADPGEVRAADDEVSAEALQREFLELAEGMQELDTDAATIGDALDMVLAEADVADAARQVRLAELRAQDARDQLAAAQAMPENDPCDGCHDAKASMIAAAEADLADAERMLAAARHRLREALAVAADLAASMREGLRRRHGRIAEAHATAPVAHAADRDFYTGGQS
jgi:hypothetical protein